MKRILGILFALFFLVGCGSRPEKAVPSVLLTESQMVDVMTDVQIIESAIAYKKSSNGKMEYLKTRGYDTVFAHYGINDSLFVENFKYYSSDPAVMQRILDSVVVKITAMPEE